MHNFLLVLTAIAAPMLTGSRAAVISSRQQCESETLYTGRLRLWQPFTPGGELQQTNAHVTGGTSPGDAFTWTTPFTGDTFQFYNCPNSNGPFTISCISCAIGLYPDPDDDVIGLSTPPSSAKTDWTLMNYGEASLDSRSDSDIAHSLYWIYGPDGKLLYPVIPGLNEASMWYATMNDDGNFVYSADAINQFPYFALEFELDS